MKKALLLVLGIIAVCFLLANIDYLADFVNTLATGALIPIVVSILLMLGRHFVQAASYDAAFDAVGHRTGFWHNVVLIFSLVFINTFCLFSGATGVAFIIDDAHRRGCDAGQATGGAILSQIGYFAAVFVISIIGFLTMLLSGRVNWLFIAGGLALGATMVALSSLFFIGYRKPRVLYGIMLRIETALNKVLGVIRKSMSAGWGRKTAHSFINTSHILAKNPKGTLITVAYASFSAILNMSCLVAIGYAFGFEHVGALIAAFAVSAISVILSPTPQGVGVVEASIAAILTAYGCSLATATAIALVYRGIMFWIPFCIGAALLSQSGFFASKKTATQLQKHKDIAWISGTLVLIIGLVNVGLVFVPGVFTPFTMLTEWINIGALFVGVPLIISSVMLIVCAIGLILRFRTAWALTITLLVLIAGSEFLFEGTIRVGAASLLLVVWLFAKRDAFDRPFSIKDMERHAEELKEEWGHRKQRGWKRKPKEPR
ncbi:MAG: UPF0104 family protein [Eggerthellaceae bacterium]|nr:UPF0104 family protein [Eggerthellaceae bacterium]